MSEKPGSRPSAVQGRRDAAVVSMSQSLHTSGSMRGSWIALRIAPSILMPVRFLWSYARCIGHPPATRCFSAYGKLAGAWATLAKQRSRLRSPRWRSAAGSRKPRPEASIRRRAPAVLVRSCSPTLVPMVVTWTQRSPTCAGGQTLPNAKKTRYSRRVRTVLKVSTVMHKRNENLTKAYSVRVRSGSISGKNRTQGECTDNYYQAVAERSRVLAPPLPDPCSRLHPSHMSQIAPFAETGRALHGAHHLRPMQHVHQCTRFTTTIRDSASTECALCGKPIANSPTGRPRTYCSAACRQKAYRNRLLLRNPLSRALEGVSLQLSAIRDPDTAHSAISDPAAANEFTWQACTGDSRA